MRRRSALQIFFEIGRGGLRRPTEVARSLFPLGHLNDLLGSREEAGRYFRRFVEVVEKSKAGADDDVAVAYVRLGCLASKEGKRDEAADFDARAFKMFEAASDKRPPLEGGVINGKAVSKPQPAYPPAARAARAQGTVNVQVKIDETGSVVSAAAVSGHPLLRAAAVAAARQAKFSPTLLSGKPVKVTGVLTYNFVLEQ